MAGPAHRPAAPRWWHRGRERVPWAARGFAAIVVPAATILTAACAPSPTRSAEPVSTQPSAPTIASIAVEALPVGFNVHLAGPTDPEAAAGSGAGAPPPSADDMTRAVVGLVWPSAYRLRPDFTAEPWLLSAPASVVSTDPFVVEWRIRPEANWSDGTPVSVDDLEFLYRRCAGIDGEPGCFEDEGYDRIAAFEKVDAKTARITFDPPYVEYENLFRWIPPSHVVEERDGWEHAFATDPGPSAGPFVVAGRQPGESLVLERNDEYFGDDAEVDRLVLRVVEAGEQPDALRSGQVALAVPPARLDLRRDFEAVDGAEVVLGLEARSEMLVFNLEHPILSVPAVRRAIALGVGRAEMADALVVPVSPAASPLDHRAFVPGQTGYEPHGAEFERRDVDRARAELANAGLVADAEGVFALGDQALELRISTTSGDVAREQAAQLVQAQLDEVGIRLTIDNAPEGELAGRLAAGDFDIALVGRSMGPFPVSRLHAIYGTGGDVNWSRFSHPRVDELLAAASVETAPEARALLLNQVDEMLWELLPDLPLFQPPFMLVHGEQLEGVTPNPTYQGFLWNAEAWRISSPGP